MAKDLFKADQVENNQTVYQTIDSINELRNSIIKKEIPNKIIDIFEKTLEFNSQQQGKGIKILTSKEMLRRLPVALAQVKSGNNSENLLNEIRQIICSLYKSKEITKKYIII